jgi:hypothetical protein
VALPEQIRKQTEAVQQLYRELNTENTDTQQAEVSGGETDEVQADSVEDTAPRSEQKEQDRSGAQNEDTYEQRWRTLQGMYNAEVPRLHTQNKELATRVNELERLLSSLSATPAQSKTATEKLITDKDVQEYGESIDVMRRVSREEAGAYQARIDQLEQLVRSMQASVLPKVEQITQRQQQSSEQTFWSDLTAYVPDWRSINENQEFQSWLLEVDPLTGLSRQTYLDDAQRNLDARRVANFFTSWVGNSGQAVAQTSRKASASQLEKQVSPGKSKAPSSAPTGNVVTYTPTDIKSFFDDVRAGRYRGRETERDRIERDIFAAQREGRIVAA